MTHPSKYADIREFAQQDPVYGQPSPHIVDLVERGATLASLNQSA
jgi:3-hydroxyacyl-CoA dehydrogenase